MSRRALLSVLLTLALAVPAFALAGNAGPQGLAVTASLGGCGTTAQGISCRIDVSWSPVEGAERYTITVTRPDGAVLELGSSSGTSTTVWVPYGGAGSYGVTVTAWGEEDEEGRRKPIASGDADPAAGSETADEAGAQPQPEPQQQSEEPESAPEQQAPDPEPEPAPAPAPPPEPQSEPAPEATDGEAAAAAAACAANAEANVGAEAASGC